MEPLNDEPVVGPNPQRRRAFRLRMPKGERLIASIDGVDHVVLEVSEFGLVIEAVNVASVDGVCQGVIHWDTRSRSEFKGSIGGAAKGGRVIENVIGISMRDMVRLQRELLKRYPAVGLWKIS